MGGELSLVATLLLAMLVGVAATAYLEAALRFARRPEVARRWGEGSAEYDSVIAVMDEPLRLTGVLSSTRGFLLGVIYALAVLAGVIGGTGRSGAVFSGSGSEVVAKLLQQTWLPILIALAAAQLVVMILGDALPRALGARSPEVALRRGVTVARLIRAVYRPMEAIIRAFRRRDDDGREASSVEEEIRFLVEATAEEGGLEDDEREMIHSIFALGDTPVRQVMVPRTDMVCVDASSSLAEAVNLVLESGHSRLPVYEDNVDRIIGVVHAKDMLHHLLGEDHRPPLRELMREPTFIPESKKLDEVLREFRAAVTQLGIVVDEFGGTAGLVSIEDIVEEIVGEIQDEYDTLEEVPAILERGPEGDLIDARIPIDEVNDELGLGIPQGDYETLGGYVFGLFGRPPREGESVTENGTEYVVERMDGRRLAHIRARPAPEEPPVPVEM